MTDVEAVGLWAGLLASVISVVLSFVAIAFAVHVDRRSREVSDQTIRSLQKIESATERVAEDTRELIKAGWDKMLGSVGGQSAATRGSDLPAREVAAGIADELRAELNLGQVKRAPEGESRSSEAARLDEFIKTLETTLSAQLKARSDRPADLFERLTEVFPKLSVEAQALARLMARRHLTLPQYHRLREGPLSAALLELRSAGLLVPVRHGQEPCFFFPPGMGRVLRAAVSLMPAPPEETMTKVQGELEKVDYKQRRGGSESPAAH